MKQHVLTLNAGSSSIKFALFALKEADDPAPVLEGQVEKIGIAPRLICKSASGDKSERDLTGAHAADHAGACAVLIAEIESHYPDADVAVVGHRVVHGGPNHVEPVILDAVVLTELEKFVAFAPLHQPHNLAGVKGAQTAFPDARQIACFDTAFHRNHPRVNDVFALPRKYYDAGVRRYGFHGLSYEYITDRLRKMSPTLHSGRVVVAHLGNGASMCGLLNGRSVGSTMGFTALDGLPMGTRCGQVDPGVLLYLMDEMGMTTAEVSDLLYRGSGLLGLSGLSSDMRTLQASDAPEAAEAIDYFVFRIRRELGALSAVLGGLDGLVFTGGIGENSKEVRELVCAGQDWIGIELDRAANAKNETVISTEFSRVRVMTIRTNEELVIARAAAGFVTAKGTDAKGTSV